MKQESLLCERGIWYGWPRKNDVLPPDMTEYHFNRFRDGRKIGDSEAVWVLGSINNFLTLLACWNLKGAGQWIYIEA